MPTGVYDPEQEERKHSLPREDTPEFLRQREDLHNPDTKDNQAAGDSSDPRTLKDKENLPSQDQKHPDQVGIGHTGAGEERFSVRGLFKTRKRKLIGLGGGLAIGGIVGFMLFFLPILRLESYFADINRRVFVTAESAVQNRMENLFERYMILRVLHMQRCGNKVTNECAADYTNHGIAGGAFNVWRDAKIELKFLDRFGIEVVSFDGGGGQKYKLIDKFGHYGNPGDELTIKNGKLVLGKFEGGKRIFGKEWTRFINNNTHGSEVLQRRSFRKYFVRKHDTKFWCVFKCKTRDNIDLKVSNAKARLKYKLVQRTIYPFSAKYGFLMDCFINGRLSECTPDEIRAHGIDRDHLLTQQEIDDVKDVINGRDNLKISQVIIERLFSRIVGATAARELTSTIPLVGQFYLAATVVDSLDQLDRCLDTYCLTKFAADIKMSQYVEYYQVMRSCNDEMKAGVLRAEEVGACASEFAGAHPAEESQVFQTYHPSQQKQQTAQSGVVFAATNTVTQAKKEPYVCANGHPIPAGQLVCPEKKIDQHFTVETIRNNSGVDFFADMINKYRCLVKIPVPFHEDICVGPQPVVHAALQAINNFLNAALGGAANALISALTAIPYLGGVIQDFINSVAGLFASLMQALIDNVVPLPVQLTSPGREKWDGLQAGGEASASEFGKGGYTADGQAYGLGGKKLAPAESAAILQQYNSQQQYDFQHSSFFARLTSLDNPSSLASRFIAIMPSSLSNLSSRFRTVLAKPFSSLFAFSHPAAAAVVPFSGSAFGIPQFGYTVNDPAFTADPALYTPAYCQALKDSWEAPTSKTEDPLTGIDEYSTTNPCLLEQAVAEAATSVFTGNDCLDDSIVPSGTCSSGTAPTTLGACPVLNTNTPNATECKWIQYIGQKVKPLLPGSPAEQAKMAAQVTWWSLKEGVLDASTPENPIGYSNCGDTPAGNHDVSFLYDCRVHSWQAGISGVQPNDHDAATVAAKAQSLHPGKSLNDIIGQVAIEASYPQGSSTYNQAITATGTLRNSLIIRDPATGFVFSEQAVQPCIDKAGPSWCYGNWDTAQKYGANQSIVSSVVSALTGYFSGATP